VYLQENLCVGEFTDLPLEDAEISVPWQMLLKLTGRAHDFGG
jgi:hypothetical protein